MKKIYALILIAIFFTEQFSTAQLFLKPADTTDPSIPQWARMMYSENPNVFEVDMAFNEYQSLHPDIKNRHTAYYMHWKKYVQPFVQEDGSIIIPSIQERKDLQQHTKTISNSSRQSSDWHFAGPEKNFRARYNTADTIAQISWHANMYCIDQSTSNPNTLFAGGENGGVYKSTDKGLTWQYVSLNDDMVTVSSVAINPSDENDVLVNADNESYHSTNGGATWGSPIASLNNKSVWQFIHNPANTQIVYAGTNDGLYRSNDGGNSWSQIFSGECQSVAIQPSHANVVFALQYNSTTKIADFYKSLDSGATFTIKPTGWFSVPSVDSGLIQSFGGRIAITEADANRVYVLLPGESQGAALLQLNGQIGIYRSDNAGESWSLPHVLIGTPYDVVTHPNMMTFAGDNSTYAQIYYNTTLVASQLDADKILIGGMSMWTSTDGAATYQPVGGYVGPIKLIHPDNQEFKIYKTSPTTEEIWFANDGGINYSNDFVQTHESRCNGLFGSAFWGFDQGWNDDIMVGGRYHNGNSARRDGYPAGEFQQLGGGEAASGYVNYSDEKKTYFSDIDGVVLSDTLNGIATHFSVGEDPNESYSDNSSSRILFDWDYWNVSYMGKDNRILKSTNGGGAYGELYSFGSASGDRIYWIEQSRANTNVLYAQQETGGVSVLWKSTDRGLSWTTIPLPQSKREINFTLSDKNADELWISFPKGSNGNKVYNSINSGASWTNTTTAILDDFEIETMCHQFGTDGGVYIGTYHGPVFYRNNTLSDWQVVGTNLPFISYPLRLVPFYRDNKLRLATWHLGIWENELYEPSNLLADFSADYKAFYCPGDTVRFVPHCVSSDSATYQWIFNGASPSSSTAMYPDVIFNTSGSFDVTLIVTDNGVNDTITKNNFITAVPLGILPLQEDFETGNFSIEWKLKGTATSSSNWTVSNVAGGFGNSTYSMRYNNWDIDIHGDHDAVWTAKYDFSNIVDAKLFFDVAYVPYGSANSDTLEVLVSTDCGATFTSLYLRGGTDLATAPANTSSVFVPTSSEWRTDTIDVNAFVGNSEVLFSFVNRGYFGQALYVDNININALINHVSQIENDFNFSVFPNPVSSVLKIESDEKITEIRIYDVPGNEVLYKEIFNPASDYTLSIGNLKQGAYFIEITSANKKGVSRFMKID